MNQQHDIAYNAPTHDKGFTEPALPRPKSKNPFKRPFFYGVSLFFIVIVGALTFLLFRQLYSQNERPTVKVGALMAFSGGSSNMGYGMMKGIQLAKKQLGASNIEIVQADSKCEPNTAREAMDYLIQQGVVAVIGDGCSSASVAVLPAANNAKVTMVSPAASSTSLSIPNDYFFRVIPNDDYQAQFMAQAIRDRKIDTVAVVYTNEPYGASMKKTFEEKFEILGGTVVATAFSEPDVIDLDAQIKTVKAANPKAIFIAPNSVVTATAIINNARNAGITVPLFGADIMYDDTIITNSPQDSNGLVVSTFSTGRAAFKQLLRSEYGVVEQLYAAPQAYDAFEAIYRAVEGGAKNGEDIKDALPQIQFDGMSARIEFDQNGEVPGFDYRYDLLQIKDREFAEIE